MPIKEAVGGGDLETLALRRLRVLAAVLLAWGVIHFIGYPTMPIAWGVVLALAGALGFVFTEPALLLLYVVALAWAGLANLLTGTALGVINGAVQGLLALTAWRTRRGLRPATGNGSIPRAKWRAAHVFPVGSAALGLAALCGSAALLCVGYVMVKQGLIVGPPRGYDAIIETVTGLGALGLGAAVAALAHGYPRRGWAVLGLVTSLLVLALETIAGVWLLLA